MKIVKISLIALTILFISGCESKIKDRNGNEKNTFEMNETAVYKEINYTVTNIEYLYGSGYGYKLTNKDNVILAVTYQVKNNSKKDYSIINLEPHLNVDGKDANSYTYVREPQKIDLNILKPGEMFVETDYYEIKDENRKLKFKLIVDDDKNINFKINNTN